MVRSLRGRNAQMYRFVSSKRTVRCGVYPPCVDHVPNWKPLVFHLAPLQYVSEKPGQSKNFKKSLCHGVPQNGKCLENPWQTTAIRIGFWRYPIDLWPNPTRSILPKVAPSKILHETLIKRSILWISGKKNIHSKPYIPYINKLHEYIYYPDNIIHSIYVCVYPLRPASLCCKKNLFPLKKTFLSSYFLHPSETVVDISSQCHLVDYQWLL